MFRVIQPKSTSNPLWFSLEPLALEFRILTHMRATRGLLVWMVQVWPEVWKTLWKSVALENMILFVNRLELLSIVCLQDDNNKACEMQKWRSQWLGILCMEIWFCVYSFGQCNFVSMLKCPFSSVCVKVQWLSALFVLVDTLKRHIFHFLWSWWAYFLIYFIN